MSRQIQAMTPQSTQGINVYIDTAPDVCPRCHNGIDAKGPFAAGLSENEAHSLTVTIEAVFRCPRSACTRYFIARYIKRFSNDTNFFLHSTTPREPAEPNIAKEVVDVSPAFKQLYAQAVATQSYALDQIAGAGYRKSLEFLIKDYCISLDPPAADAIRKEFLARTIADRVADQNIKQCATRATWLGNDETHYERRWDGKDLEDLKVLIRLTMNWIANSVMTAKYVKDMPTGE